MEPVNTPVASHFGGFRDRLIRLLRKVLYSVMQEQIIQLDHEGFQTLFSEVEAVLSGKTLVEHSNNTNGLEVLTPNNFFS